jgi:hypothetical protein
VSLRTSLARTTISLGIRTAKYGSAVTTSEKVWAGVVALNLPSPFLWTSNSPEFPVPLRRKYPDDEGQEFSPKIRKRVQPFPLTSTLDLPGLLLYFISIFACPVAAVYEDGLHIAFLWWPTRRLNSPAKCTSTLAESATEFAHQARHRNCKNY